MHKITNIQELGYRRETRSEAGRENKNRKAYLKDQIQDTRLTLQQELGKIYSIMNIVDHKLVWIEEEIGPGKEN